MVKTHYNETMAEKEKRKNQVHQQHELASVGARFVALMVDNTVLSFVSTFSLSFTGPRNSLAFSLLVYFLYYWLFWTQRDGQTPGKMLMRIKIIRTDGQPLTAGDCVLRYLGYFIDAFAFGLGFLWAAFDKNNQGWHDKIARTYVVRSQAAEQHKKYVTI